MKKLLRTLTTVALATVVSGTLVAGLAGTASAFGTAPPWESTITPTPEVGGLTFYNSAGQVITGGSTATGPIAAYIQGSSIIRAGDTTAVVDAYTPVNGVAAGGWSGEGVSSVTNFPNAGAPASLASSNLPLVTGSATDYSLEDYVGDFPNNDTSSTDGYAGLYVLRLFTGASGKAQTSNYDEAVISIDNTTNTWTLDYDPSTATTTTLAESPASPQLQGTTVALTATVTPGAPGTVQFENGGSPLGSPVAVSGGTATANVTGLPVGANSLTAVFTPTTGSAFAGSTSSASNYTITAPAATTTTLGVSPASPQVVNTSETLTATVTPGSGVAGSVQFLDNGTALGAAVPVTAGSAALTTTALPVGTDSLTATFTPTTIGYAPSTSSPVSFVVQSLGDTTVTALSVNPSTAPVTTAVTITANVSDSTIPASIPTGTVQFTDNGSNLGSAVALVNGVATDNVTSGLSVGANNLVAIYSGASPSYKPSTSLGVLFTGLDANGSTGPDPQNLQVGVPAGTLTISTPYTSANPFQLGNASLINGGSEFQAIAAFGTYSATDVAASTTDAANGGVLITDTRAGDAVWTASAQVSDFTNGTNSISGENLAFTGVKPVYITGNALQANDVATNDVTSTATTGSPYPAGASGTDGLSGEAHAFANTTSAPNGGDGSVFVDGTLNLVAPSSTPAGTYSATLTFTIV